MKKETIISSSLIVFGFLCEYIYFYAENTIFNLIIVIIGIFALIAGVLGLWIYTILPAINGVLHKTSGKNDE